MKQSHIVSLLQTGYTTVEVSYTFPAAVISDPTLEFPLKVSKTYTFKVLDSLKLQKGDLLLVPSLTKGITVVQVTEVHIEPQINLDADWDYKWVIDKVDLSTYQQLLLVEKEAIGQLRKVEASKRRDEILDGLRGTLGDGITALEYDVNKLRENS